MGVMVLTIDSIVWNTPVLAPQTVGPRGLPSGIHQATALDIQGAKGRPRRHSTAIRVATVDPVLGRDPDPGLDQEVATRPLPSPTLVVGRATILLLELALALGIGLDTGRLDTTEQDRLHPLLLSLLVL